LIFTHIIHFQGCNFYFFITTNVIDIKKECNVKELKNEILKIESDNFSVETKNYCVVKESDLNDNTLLIMMKLLIKLLINVVLSI
jgi:hypothetical protein